VNLGPRNRPSTRTWSPRLDADDEAMGRGAFHRGRRTRLIRRLAGGFRRPCSYRDGAWRPSAPTTPAESTRARMAKMTCSGSEIQAAQRRARRASAAVKSCNSVPGSRCCGAASERGEIRKPLPPKRTCGNRTPGAIPASLAESDEDSVAREAVRHPGKWRAIPVGPVAGHHVSCVMVKGSVALARTVGTILVQAVAMRPHCKRPPVGGPNVRNPLFSNGLQRIPSTRQVRMRGPRVRFRS
jgi:hypothetical protein